MGWWFGRILTFEVVADDAPMRLGDLLEDASAGLIHSDAAQELAGFAAYGSSIKNAVQPLVDCFGIDLFDDGTRLRGAAASAATSIREDELGNSADNSKAPRLTREQVPVSEVPAALRLAYYDPARDYQMGEARAVAGEETGTESREELAAVLSAGDAKSLANQMLARAWANRDKLTLRLPPAQLALEPGDTLELPFSPPLWTVEKASIDGFVVVAELRPASGASIALAGDGGRIVPNSDIVAGPLNLALLDIPNVFAPGSNEPTLWVAAATASAGWKRSSVQIDFGGQGVTIETARAKTVLGSASTVLGPATAELIDEINGVDIALIDGDQWLTSCDRDALAAGKNLAVLGNELIQFGRATALGGGQFRLTQLLRGRGGTEWACASHLAGESFCLIDPGSLQSLAIPTWTIGALVSAAAGDAETSITFAGESVRPLSPVNLSAVIQSNGDLLLGWVRRSRTGFAWVDGMDAPLGESREEYRVDLTGSAGTFDATIEEPALTIAAADLVNLGAGMVTVEVRQIGDLAVSWPGQLSIAIS